MHDFSARYSRPESPTRDLDLNIRLEAGLPVAKERKGPFATL